ncbi:tyrosine-type recombinase/integrase [Desulfosporosinus sp. SYSU MS00001]|uniref:tyrosine-type recombinase/integrase n=1 Tax=Desulfosporosinus sp. SYSU MS00001 TaxID=3416284 RepID=UPI003CF1E5C2
MYVDNLTENNQMNLAPLTDNIIKSFINQMAIDGNSNHTIQAYNYYLRRFFLDTGKSVDGVTHSDLTKWISKFRWVDSSRYAILSILSSFSDWCIGRKLMTKNLVKKDDRPKKIKRTPRYLKEAELSAVEIEIEKQNLRNRCICEFFLSTGVRCNELRELMIKDLNPRERKALITGKGKTERKVEYSETCALLLDRYIGNRTNPYEPLFLDRLGKQISNDAIRAMVKRLGIKAGLSRRLTPHMFRHTFATLKVIQGYTLQQIGDMLGHEELENTKIYAQILIPELMTLYDRYMR